MSNPLNYLRNLCCAALIAALVSIQAPANAQDEVDDAALTAAVELVRASGMSKMLETMLPLISNQIIDLMVKVKPELKGQYDAFIREFLKTAMGEGREEVFREIAMLYARKFTADEINDVVAFYKSPTGLRMLELLPEIQAEASKIGQAWGSNVARRSLERLRAKLKEDGHEF